MSHHTVDGASYSGSDGILLARMLTAPRERVWREWTEPERFSRWYGGDNAEIPLDTVTMDVRVGGTWRATMFAGPERREIHWDEQYLDVVEPKLLVLTLTDDKGEPYELVTVVLVELGGGLTEMIFRQRGSMSGPEYEQTARGWSSFFDHMAEGLARG
jgi:uncharacterized protein YndB with AHSA1/START domain